MVHRRRPALHHLEAPRLVEDVGQLVRAVRQAGVARQAHGLHRRLAGQLADASVELGRVEQLDEGVVVVELVRVHLGSAGQRGTRLGRLVVAQERRHRFDGGSRPPSGLLVELGLRLVEELARQAKTPEHGP